MASLGLFMICVLAATATELTELKPVRRGLLILCRHIIATLTLVTLKHYVIARHNLIRSLSFVLCALFSPGLVPNLRPSTKIKGQSSFPIPLLPIPCRLPPYGHPHEWRSAT